MCYNPPAMTEVLKPPSPEITPKTLGKFLERKTQEQGLSIKTLAEACKVHPSTVKRAFGDGRSRASTIFSIFNGLSISGDEATQILSKFRPQNRFWFIR